MSFSGADETPWLIFYFMVRYIISSSSSLLVVYQLAMARDISNQSRAPQIYVLSKVAWYKKTSESNAEWITPLCMFLWWVFLKGKTRDQIQDSSLSHHQGTFLKSDIFLAQPPNYWFLFSVRATLRSWLDKIFTTFILPQNLIGPSKGVILNMCYFK